MLDAGPQIGGQFLLQVFGLFVILIAGAIVVISSGGSRASTWVTDADEALPRQVPAVAAFLAEPNSRELVQRFTHSSPSAGLASRTTDLSLPEEFRDAKQYWEDSLRLEHPAPQLICMLAWERVEAETSAAYAQAFQECEQQWRANPDQSLQSLSQVLDQLPTEHERLPLLQWGLNLSKATPALQARFGALLEWELEQASDTYRPEIERLLTISREPAAMQNPSTVSETAHRESETERQNQFAPD